jgi:hypothetical protein
MDLLSSARIIWRHKWVVAGLLVLTVVVAFVIGGGIKPTYKTSGQMVLLPPTGVDPTATTVPANPAVTDPTAKSFNPFLSAQGLGVLANAAVVVVNDKQSVDRIVAAGGLDTFVLAAGDQGGGSFITLDVTGSVEAKVLSTYSLVADAYKAEISRQQDLVGVQAKDQTQANPLVTPKEASKDVGSRVQAMLIILLLGGIAAIGAAFLLQSILDGRARAKADQAAGEHELLPLWLATDDEPNGVAGPAKAERTSAER